MKPETAATAPENLVDLMNKLIDAPEPMPVSLMPQTVGWAVLAVALAIAAVLLVRALRQQHKANSYRRAALAALDGAGGDPRTLARLIRQTALAAFPRERVAGLYGDAWLTFLDETCEAGQFRNGPGRFVAEAPYIAEPRAPADGVAAVRHWIAHHRTEDAT